MGDLLNTWADPWTADVVPPTPVVYGVPGTALWRSYELFVAKRWAARAKIARRGWCEAYIRRTRRVLRMTPAAIFSNRVRIVAAHASANSVPCSANSRKRCMSV